MRKKSFQGQQFRPRISKQEYEHILSRRNERVKENRVMVIFDLHAPFIKYGYLDFCKSIYQKYNCNQVVLIGDIIDNQTRARWLDFGNWCDDCELSTERRLELELLRDSI
jgi:hypothetical protein